MIYHTRDQWNNHAECGYKNNPEPDIVQALGAARFFDRLIIDIDRLLFQSDSLLVEGIKISK
jgi:hypothetical protein